MNEENTQEVQQQEQPQQEAQQTTTQEVAEKPSYLGDEYWENGQVNLEKMSKDLAETKKREKGLREKLSKSKEVEPFESVFEDRQYSDSQRKELNRFVEIARKSGLNKQQTESVLDAVAAWSEENNKARFEENEKQMREKLGENYEPMLDTFKRFGEQQIASKHWTESQKQAYEVMMFDADSATVLADLIQNYSHNKINFSPTQEVSGNSSWDDVYYMTNRAYDLISRGHSDEGNQLLDKAHRLNASLS